MPKNTRAFLLKENTRGCEYIERMEHSFELKVSLIRKILNASKCKYNIINLSSFAVKKLQICFAMI